MTRFDDKELQMNDLKRFWDAVMAMRAAQRLEWDALPANFRLWKRARQKQSVSRLEEAVDALAEELLHAHGWTNDDEVADVPAENVKDGES